MPQPDRNKFYDKAIGKMVAQALEEKEKVFISEYENADPRELLAYVRAQAKALGHSPWPREIVGGCWIEQRFGDWCEVMRQAGLPCPNTPDKLSSFQLVQSETERQKQLYRERREEKKRRAQQRQREQEEKRRQYAEMKNHAAKTE